MRHPFIITAPTALSGQKTWLSLILRELKSIVKSSYKPMLRSFSAAVLTILLSVASSEAILFGTFRQIDVGKRSSPLILESFDTWAFDVTNEAPSDSITALELHFNGINFLNWTGIGATTFRDSATNPTVFGFEAAETFFVVPAGTPSNILSVIVEDTHTTLKAAYTIAGGASLGDVGTTSTVAFFSVDHGTILDQDNFVSGKAVVDRELVTISYVIPEPSGLLLAITTAAFVGLIRRRG